MRHLITILLLLPLAGFLTHEMIPHHHLSGQTLDPGAHHAHPQGGLSEHSDDHTHPFPVHNHQLAAGDFLSPRMNRVQEGDWSHTFTFLTCTGIATGTQPADLLTETPLYRFVIPYRALSPWLPVANPLRAPPALA